MSVVLFLLLAVVSAIGQTAEAAAPCPPPAVVGEVHASERPVIGPPAPIPPPINGGDGCAVPPPRKATVDTGKSKPSDRHLDWLAVPLLSYDSDYGLSYGVAGQFQWAGEIDPYRHQLRFQVLFTTLGRQSHWIQYDSPRFLGTRLRFWANVGYNRDTMAPYYGLGNASSDSLTTHPELTGKNPFAYDVIQPNVRMGASYPIGPNLYAFLFAAYLDTTINMSPGSLLAEQMPYGVAGGRELQSMIGAYRDTRDHEAVPTSGSLLEVSARGAAQALGSSYTYGGLNARALKFFPLHPRLVLATRIEGDYLTHGAPFYELNQFGGVDGIDGVGGEWSVRGIPVDRYIGRGKLIGTAELRVHIADPVIHKEPISIGAVAFADVGRVWQFDGNDGNWFGMHAGYGAGVRIWRRSFVLRLDVASSVERPFNMYILFGQFF